ncbi:MAG: hypothetical protein HQL68_00200 [Magnetococcales bacterium]|nr:hypothetical protein [Magnetococcales bacterium]
MMATIKVGKNAKGYFLSHNGIIYMEAMTQKLVKELVPSFVKRDIIVQSQTQTQNENKEPIVSEFYI